MKLSQILFGELLSLPQMGARSVLDFAVTAEAAMDAVAVGLDVPLELIELAREAANAPWAELVSDEDPRFADLLGGVDGTLADRLEEITTTSATVVPTEGWLAIGPILPAITKRIETIERLPLEVALREYVASLSGLDDRRLDAVLMRFGLDGQPPRTLQHAADVLGVSRERIRQLQKRVNETLPSHPIFMPALDRALTLVTGAAPIAADDATALLLSHGIATVPFHPASLLAAARLCGRPDTFEIENTRKGGVVVTSPSLASAAQIILVASRQSDSYGASNLAELTSALEEQGMDVSHERAREVLSQYSEAEFLVDDWFWMPSKGAKRNRLYNVSRRILSVASPLDVARIRDGARRSYRFREVALIPPRNVMTAFYRAHPVFVVHADGLIGTVGPLDYRQELGKTEQIFVDVLRSSPTSLLDRASFQDGCETRGMNRNTFSVYTTYSPILDHLGTDIWSLRGVEVSPAAVDALRQANAARPRERVVEDYGWNEEGALWIAARVPRWHGSLVIGIPTSIGHYLADRRFSARAQDGSPAGTIAVNESGTSWGYGSFLTRRGADEGDVLLLEFDLATEEVVLSLGDAQFVEDMQSG